MEELDSAAPSAAQLSEIEAKKERLKASQDKYYKNHAEKCRAKSARWRANNPEKLKEYVKESYAKNKEAENARNAAYRAANKEKIAARRKAFSLANKERLNAKTLEWRRSNTELANALASAWSKANPEKVAANSAKRRAVRLKATPAWADEFVISEIYDLAKLRTEATGYEWHVDHVVPLRSKLVCGLHCEANLRVIPGSDNSSKGNRHWPDMP